MASLKPPLGLDTLGGGGSREMMSSSSSEPAEMEAELLIAGSFILKFAPSSLGGETGWLKEGVCQDGVGETERGWATGFLWFWMIVLLLLLNWGLTEFWLITIGFWAGRPRLD